MGLCGHAEDIRDKGSIQGISNQVQRRAHKALCGPILRIRPVFAGMFVVDCLIPDARSSLLIMCTGGGNSHAS